MVKHAFTSGKGDGSDAALVRASNWNADHLVDVLAPSGLTGATAAARFVGGTASGAPITGTFATNDYVIAQDGKVWLCTSAGSPGVWAQVGGAADIIQGASGGGNVRIPGLMVADRAPGGAFDDEFGSFTGWTTFGSLDALNVTDFPSHLHMSKNSIGTLTVGVYKAMPAPPFVVTARLAGAKLDSNYVNAALMVAEASPGKFWHFGPLYGGYGASINDWVASYWSSPTVRSGVLDTNGGTIDPILYLRFVVDGYGYVIPQWSRGGLIWITQYARQTMPFAMVNVGLAIAGHNGGGNVEAVWDWIRFTYPSYANAIPMMTDNTHPSGTVLASESYSLTPPWCAYNVGSTYGGWITNASALPQWIGYQFGSPQTIISYSFRPYFYDNYPGRTPKTWEFQGSNDNFATHTTLDTQTNWASANSNDVVVFPISSPASFSYYRLYVTANNGNAYTGLSSFNMNVAR